MTPRSLAGRAKASLVRRLQRFLDVPDSDNIRRLNREVAELHPKVNHALAEATAEVPPDPELARLAAQIDELGARIAEVQTQLSAGLERLHVLDEILHRTDERTNLLYRIESLRAVVEAHTPTNPPLITVVTPTHNRCDLLPRTIASVQRQTYPHWEHVIAIDRCSDSTLDYVRDVASSDPRVKFIVTDRGRCGAARMDALTLASGSLVTYLDDDNQFDRNWLASVAWAFESYPHLQALYGVLVIDHPDRTTSRDPAQDLPALFLQPFDREALAEHNFVDTGTIAHRAGTPESHFDPDLTVLGDWEMFGRLASVTTPLALPALSVIYRTVADDRLSYDHPGHPLHDVVRARLRARLLGEAPPS